MNMPGFTAEAALYKKNENYNMTVDRAELSFQSVDTVQPAGPLTYAACLAICAPFSGGLGFGACLAGCIPFWATPL